MAKHRAELDETQVDVQLRETEQRRAVLACADNIIMPIIAADGSTNFPGLGNASNADGARVEGRVAAACPKAPAATEVAGLFARLTTPTKFIVRSVVVGGTAVAAITRSDLARFAHFVRRGGRPTRATNARAAGCPQGPLLRAP